ncbi:MAG: UvrD-helicase domain-containing protein [Pseudomonadales bacterium]|nr:UvrD-helicase domain-containing protein [Pseudomonadales bacterium]
MSKPADHTARTEAQDIQRSFIVQAPAGSGKTELLTMRILRLLAVVEQPEEILCITFTNKAAAEMKERILSSIEPAFTEQTHDQDHKNEKARLGKQVYQRSTEKSWNLLLNPGRLAVRTIDSFNHFLIRQMPASSGMGSSVEITEEPIELYQLAVRNLLELADNDTQLALKHLLQHLDNRYDRVEQRLIEMLAIRDQWLPMVLHEEPEQMLEHIEQNLQDLIESELKTVRKKLFSTVPNEFFKHAALAGKNLLEAGTESPIALLADLDSIPDHSINSLKIWKAISELVLTKQNGIRLKPNKNQGFPAGKANAAHKAGFIDCLQVIGSEEELVERLALLKTLPYPNYPESQKKLLSQLFVLLKTLYASLKIVFDEQQACDHGEISLAALQALGTDQQPTDLALSLDYRFQHILIDEFQDTSNLQIQLLEKLTQGWQVGDGRSLFLVGDPMQSIYKFRQADVGIYLSTQQNGIGNIQLKPLRLTANFRSQATLINWINSQFNLVFGNSNSWLHGEIAYSASTAARAALPASVAVESFLFVDPPDQTAQAQKIIELIDQSRQLEPDGEIAILVRARGHLLAIVEQLKQADIPFRAVEIDPLQYLPYIRDLQTLTRVLCHPADRIAWLALIRSPLCGLTLDSLLLIANSGSDQSQSQTTIWQQLQNPELIQRLPSDDQLRIEKLKIPLTRCFDQTGRKAFRILLEGCWLELGGMLLAEDPADRDNVDRFFVLIEKLTDSGQLPDIKKLESRVEKLYAQPQASDPNAIQIMTIHKAKGLEFSTVILPSLERKPANNESKLLNWHLYKNDQNHNELLLAPVQSATEDSEDSIQAYLKYIDQKRASNELKRVLYVATTRAKNRLFLLGTIKEKPVTKQADKHNEDEISLLDNYSAPVKNSLLAFLWPTILEQAQLIEPNESAEGSVDLPSNADINEEANTLLRLPLDWQSDVSFPASHSLQTDLNTLPEGSSNKLPSTEANSNSSAPNNIATAIGTLVHRALAQITQDGIKNWNQERFKKQLPVWRSQLRQLGVYDGLDKAATIIEKQVSHCCTGQHGVWLLDNGHIDSQTEYPITVQTSTGYKQYRVDRTFIDEQGTRWIIDYKSSQPSSDTDNNLESESLEQFLRRQANHYQKQMQAYYEGFQKLEDRAIKLALYYPAIDYLQVL